MIKKEAPRKILLATVTLWYIPLLMTTTVYQITKLAEHPDEQPIIIAMTSKKSAKRIIAALAEQGELARAEYRVTRFSHPELELHGTLTEKGPLEC